MPVENKGTEDLWICERGDARKLEDEYLLGDIIGRGKFSTIYKCLRKGRTEWTCKVIEKRRLNRSLAKSKLSKLVKLKHSNIIRIKEIFETQSAIQLITEYVTGDEIFEKIVEKGQYSEQDAAKALRDILLALKYLHGEGIVHGDIKPENLLYENETDDSRLKLADFGLSQLFIDKDTIVSNNISGSVRYCAPEVLLRGEWGFPSDLWSLGVVMYIMLSGYEPFWDEDGEAATCKNIINGMYSFPSPTWDDISESAKELITKLLSVDANKRPTADEALNHPWTRGISSYLTPRDTMIKGLREYNARRRFRVATKTVLATRRAFHLLNLNQGGADDKCLSSCESKIEKFQKEKEQGKEYPRWCPVGGSSGGGHASVEKTLTLTTR